MSSSAAAAATKTAPLGYPFTHAQWKELETQAMIFKYMVASLPVPLDLLIPIIHSLSQSHSPTPYYFGGGGLTLGYGVRTDGEPGRCKRTDGKKWRCSREVAPHQKYCDRHLHRGRPRSRKLVEAQANGGGGGVNTNGVKKTRGNMTGFPASAVTGSVSFSGAALAPQDDGGVPLVVPGDDDNSSFLTLEPSYRESRDVDWLMIGDHSTGSAYNSFAASSHLEPTDYTKAQAPHHSFFGSDLHAHSSLTLSMAGANDGEMGSRPVDSSSWVPLVPLGGPLAEALGCGIASTPSNPSSPNMPRNVNDGMGSSVMARTLTSLSDGSSPRLGASPFSRSEFTVQWFNPPNNLASFAN